MNYVNSLLEDNQILNQMLNDDTQNGKVFLPYTESEFGYENFQANKKIKIGDSTNVKREAFVSKPDLSLVLKMFIFLFFSFL